MSFEDLVRKGRTHDFDKLPKVMWAATGETIPCPDIYQPMKETRNSIQHFCAAEDDQSFIWLSLQFIYSVLDPLIQKHFGLYAINFQEDHDIGYDYVVGCLLRREIKFLMPPDFEIHEIDPHEELKNASPAYAEWYVASIKALT
ncbi:hypothetical protein [Ahrensia marina]|uniref:hypothetical protein n=1 Tax=Ahrensia marina TaxID=1514904 RepID=UPI000B068436|nr:hypothetical protein [Ahrensia marina]